MKSCFYIDIFLPEKILIWYFLFQRVSGKGLKKVSGYGYGDHYVHLKVEAPKKLDEKQRALLRAYAELESETPGTITGVTYTKGGQKIVMEDPEGLVADIREALEASRVKGKDENSSTWSHLASNDFFVLFWPRRSRNVAFHLRRIFSRVFLYERRYSQ